MQAAIGYTTFFFPIGAFTAAYAALPKDDCGRVPKHVARGTVGNTFRGRRRQEGATPDRQQWKKVVEEKRSATRLIQGGRAKQACT